MSVCGRNGFGPECLQAGLVNPGKPQDQRRCSFRYLSLDYEIHPEDSVGALFTSVFLLGPHRLALPGYELFLPFFAVVVGSCVPPDLVPRTGQYGDAFFFVR